MRLAELRQEDLWPGVCGRIIKSFIFIKRTTRQREIINCHKTLPRQLPRRGQHRLKELRQENLLGDVVRRYGGATSRAQ